MRGSRFDAAAAARRFAPTNHPFLARMMLRPFSDRRTPGRLGHRRGVTAIELAICLPVLVLVTLATVEACTMLYLKQSLKIAAYEACRVALVPDAEPEHIDAQCARLLSSRNVRGYSFTMHPPHLEQLARGDLLRISVSAPCFGNCFLGGWFYADRELTESVEMMAE